MKPIALALGNLKCGKWAFAIGVLCAISAIAQPPTPLTTLHSFDSSDGANPVGSLVQATNGEFYGTAVYGGANACPLTTVGCGTIFRMFPTGALQTLYSFCSQVVNNVCTDGSFPQGGLIQATNGELYGTTIQGGANCSTSGGCGTVFKIAPTGVLTTLYSFCSSLVNNICADGELPFAGLMLASNGALYGTTVAGGTYNFGTIFRITPNGNLATLHSFSGPDGAFPQAPLVQAANGDLYGTTYTGGANCQVSGGCGTIFKIAESGVFATLYSFCSQSGCTDGAGSSAALLQAAGGDLYGTTYNGGVNCQTSGGCGTVFKITPSGTLTTLYSFCAQTGCTDGSYPATGLLQANNGELLGKTYGGGSGAGTVFKITPAGRFGTLYSFCSQTGCPDGSDPSSLIQATSGSFYGTTLSGGANDTCNGEPLPGCGTVFEISLGLSPFVEALPNSGNVGATIRILGTNLTGATSVTFNGLAAVFTVVSSSEITATVPAGATTGKITVITPQGTLSSNIKFQIP